MARPSAKTLFPGALFVLALALILYVLTRHGDRALVLYGNVEIRQVELSFRVEGRIARLLVDEGDSVHKGQILARLDSDVYEAALRQAEAQVQAQEAQLARLEAGYRSEEVAQAEEQVRAARAQADLARIQLERIRNMHRQNATSQQALDNALSAARQSRAELAAAEQVYAMHASGYRKEDIAAQKATLAAARAQADLARIRHADCELAAPGDGIVLTRAQEEGAIVAAGSPVLTLTLRDPVWLRVYVDEPHLGRIRPGMAVEVLADCSQAPFAGTVGYISPAAEFTPKNVETSEVRTSLVYRIRVLAKDPDNMLRQGMPVRVRLPEEDR